MKMIPLAVSWIYKGFDPVMIVSVHLCLSNNWKIHLTLALRNHIPEYLQKCANPAMLLQQRGVVYTIAIRGKECEKPNRLDGFELRLHMQFYEKKEKG